MNSPKQFRKLEYTSLLSRANRRPLVYNSIVAPLSNTPPTAGTEAYFSPTSLSDIIIEKFAYGVENLSKYHTFVTNLKGNKPLPIVRQPVLAMGCQDGCNMPSDDVRVRKSEKMLSPKQIGYTATQCFSDLVNSNLSFMYNGLDRGNLTKNEDFMAFWAELTVEFTMAEILRKAWFDNTSYAGGSALLTPQASSGGAWINPTEDYFSCIDGLFSQLEAQVGGINHVTIAENAGLTFAAQALPANAAYNYLSQMLAIAPTTVFSDPNAVFLVTRSMYANLWASATAVTNFTTGAVSAASNISIYNNELFFGGIRLVVFDAWDYTIRTFFNDGVRFHNPHRAVLTSISNLIIAADVDSLTSVYDEVEYSKDRDVVFQRFRTTLDAKTGLDEQIVFAF